MKNRIFMKTNNKEIYQKLNLLNIVPEVIIENNNKEISRILKYINKRSDSIECKIISNNMVMLKKKNNVKLDIYIR